jgi:hypothetical protein
MSARPQTEWFDGVPKGAAEFGQFVVKTPRRGGKDSSFHQAVSLSSAQRDDEHPL